MPTAYSSYVDWKTEYSFKPYLAGFLVGSFTGTLTELLGVGSRTNLGNLVESCFVAGLVIPFVFKFGLKRDWEESYKDMPEHAVSYMAGQTFIKYVRQLIL